MSAWRKNETVHDKESSGILKPVNSCSKVLYSQTLIVIQNLSEDYVCIPTLVKKVISS
jgi:hypothetical protein